MSLDRPTLHVIIGSTRPQRVGGAIARWFYELALDRESWNVEMIDLAEVNLPFLDEPEQPSRGDYVHEHTKRWAATIERADAVVFVIPEYNHGLNGATKNAVDFLYQEWHYKPFGVVCYGGASRGLRSATSLKTTLAAVKMVWAGDVAISLQSTPVVDEHFDGDDRLVRSSNTLLSELEKLAPFSRGLRP